MLAPQRSSLLSFGPGKDKSPDKGADTTQNLLEVVASSKKYVCVCVCAYAYKVTLPSRAFLSRRWSPGPLYPSNPGSLLPSQKTHIGRRGVGREQSHHQLIQCLCVNWKKMPFLEASLC